MDRPSESAWAPAGIALAVDKCRSHAIYWSSEAAARAQTGNNRKTGDLIALEGKTLTWSVPGPAGAEETSTAVRRRWAELDRVGLWKSDGGESGVSTYGSAMLLSSAETVLAAAPADDGTRSERNGRASSIFRGEITGTFLWAIILLLAIESWLFHWHAVH